MVSHYAIQPHIVELLCVCFNTAMRGNSSASHTALQKALWVVRKEQAGCRSTLRQAHMLTSRGILSDFRVGRGRGTGEEFIRKATLLSVWGRLGAITMEMCTYLWP